MTHRLLILLIPVLILCGACETGNLNERGECYIVDQQGTKCYLDSNIRSIVSLAPSMTEIIYLVELESLLVARSQNCDFPQEVSGKEIIQTYPHLDMESLLALKPDIILTYEGITPESDIQKLRDLNIPVYVASMESLEDWTLCVQDVCRIGGVPVRKGKGFKEFESNGLSILGLCGVDPLYAFGNKSFQNAIFEAAGYTNAIESEFEKYPRINEELIITLDPDVILLTSKNTDLLISAHPALARCKAIKNNRIIYCPSDLISRPGGRVKETISRIKKGLD